MEAALTPTNYDGNQCGVGSKRCRFSMKPAAARYVSHQAKALCYIRLLLKASRLLILLIITRSEPQRLYQKKQKFYANRSKTCL